MQWDGNPNIVLDIKTKLGVSLPVQVIRSFLFLMVKINLIDIITCEYVINQKK